MTQEHKGLARVEVKDEDRGEVVAVFATLDVIDSDGDVTVKGAFDDGAPVRISAYGHTSWEGRLPVGKGTIREKGKEAILEGAFFLDTAAGRDTFTVVKELGAEGLQEWSYGYDPKEYSFGEFEGQQVRFLQKLKVHEVSPVLLGAGVGTRLLSAKSGGMKFADHLDAVLAELEAVGARAAEVMALRAEKGKSESEDTAERMRRVAAAAKRLEDVLAAESTPIDDEEAREAVARELARFVALTAQGA